MVLFPKSYFTLSLIHSIFELLFCSLLRKKDQIDIFYCILKHFLILSWIFCKLD